MIMNREVEAAKNFTWSWSCPTSLVHGVLHIFLLSLS